MAAVKLNVVKETEQPIKKDILFLNTIFVETLKEYEYSLQHKYSELIIDELKKGVIESINNLSTILEHNLFIKTKETLKGLGFTDKNAAFLSFFAVSSELKNYTLPGHQYRTHVVSNILGLDPNLSALMSIHDIGKVFFRSENLKGESSSLFHQKWFNKYYSVQDIIGKGHEQLGLILIAKMKEYNLFNETELKILSDLNIVLNHHSYYKYKNTRYARRLFLIRFVDSLDASLIMRSYAKKDNLTALFNSLFDKNDERNEYFELLDSPIDELKQYYDNLIKFSSLIVSFNDEEFKHDIEEISKSLNLNNEYVLNSLNKDPNTKEALEYVKFSIYLYNLPLLDKSYESVGLI